MRGARARYSRVQVVFHWLTATLVVAMLGTGFAQAIDPAGKGAIRTHQIAGQALILVLMGRIAARILGPRAPTHPGHAAWERHLAGFVHVGLYVCLIALAVSGYVSASALGDTALALPIDRAAARSDAGETLLVAHFLLKWAFLALLALHLAGTLKHVLRDRDDTLSRMTLHPRKDSDHA